MNGDLTWHEMSPRVFEIGVILKLSNISQGISWVWKWSLELREVCPLPKHPVNMCVVLVKTTIMQPFLGKSRSVLYLVGNAFSTFSVRVIECFIQNVLLFFPWFVFFSSLYLLGCIK